MPAWLVAFGEAIGSAAAAVAGAITLPWLIVIGVVVCAGVIIYAVYA
jgi:hypothetical protein